MIEKIFISYSQEDQEYAEKVQEVLAKRGLIDDDAVTLDPQKEIKVGDDIRKLIRENIGAASKVVVIVSENAIKSQWVNYEVGMAEALGKHIIIVGKRGTGKSHLVAQYLSRLGNIKAIEVDAEGE